MCPRQRTVRNVRRIAPKPRTTLVAVVATVIPTLKLSSAVVEAFPRRM
jgi:hypothetical protein